MVYGPLGGRSEMAQHNIQATMHSLEGGRDFQIGIGKKEGPKMGKDTARFEIRRNVRVDGIEEVGKGRRRGGSRPGQVTRPLCIRFALWELGFLRRRSQNFS